MGKANQNVQYTAYVHLVPTLRMRQLYFASHFTPARRSNFIQTICLTFPYTRRLHELCVFISSYWFNG